MAGRKGRGQPRQVEEHTNQIGQKKEDATDRAKWRNGVYDISRNIR